MRKLLFGLLPLAFFACTSSSEETSETADQTMTQEQKYAEDAHSYSEPNSAVVKHLDLDLYVNFDIKKIKGIATYKIETSEGATQIVFDTWKLDVGMVKDGKGNELDFEMGEYDPTFGSPLIVKLGENTKEVSITYMTNPEAKALQWLSPEQTAGKAMPFLFTQSQAILARSWVPCQDSPGIRFTYTANVQVPEGMLALMSAVNPQEKSDDGRYRFYMEQPIPSYLMAMAVGDIEFAPIGDRTGVYAEPSMLEASAYEFDEMDEMLVAAEELYGEYVWERYDLIVLPPSFPFGGMENPRLTFCTPTIIAGDRSLTALVAHELAHSWSGNLVTNATWDDFWLNEGFTVYFERRIMEAVYGREYSEMLAELGMQDVKGTVDRLGHEHGDTHLKLDLDGRDPDEGLTDIAYEKGYFFLRTIEEAVGREKFDAFLKGYFNENAFEVMDTEGFLNILNEKLLVSEELQNAVNVKAWVYGPGLPESFPEVNSSRFDAVESAAEKWIGGTPADELNTAEWTTHEWLHFLRNLPNELSTEKLAELDNAFGFTNSGNNEILAAWFQHTIRNGYTAADPAVEAFLISVGRRKFLTPTYEALIKADPSKEKARAIYAKARPNYHAVSTGTMDALLDWNSENS